MLRDGNKVEIRISRSLDRSFQRAAAIVTDTSVNVKNADYLSRRTPSLVADGKVSEVAIKQNNKPEK